MTDGITYIPPQGFTKPGPSVTKRRNADRGRLLLAGGFAVIMLQSLQFAWSVSQTTLHGKVTNGIANRFLEESGGMLWDTAIWAFALLLIGTVLVIVVNAWAARPGKKDTSSLTPAILNIAAGFGFAALSLYFIAEPSSDFKASKLEIADGFTGQTLVGLGPFPVLLGAIPLVAVGIWQLVAYQRNAAQES
jgi:hypothetical protein